MAVAGVGYQAPCNLKALPWCLASIPAHPQVLTHTEAQNDLERSRKREREENGDALHAPAEGAAVPNLRPCSSVGDKAGSSGGDKASSSRGGDLSRSTQNNLCSNSLKQCSSVHSRLLISFKLRSRDNRSPGQAVRKDELQESWFGQGEQA